MRAVEMWNPYVIAGRSLASERQVIETLRELFNSKPHVMATLAIALAGLGAAMSGMPGKGLAATLIALACGLFRIHIEHRFLTRTSHALDPSWLRLFVVGGLLSGAGWGIAGAILLYQTSPDTQTITLAVMCALVQASAGRAYMIPGTALISIALVCTGVSIGAIGSGNYLIALFAALYFSFLHRFIAHTVRHRLSQLRAEQTAERLLEEITEKNELLRLANEALAAKANADPLTGLANRRKFDLAFTKSLQAAQHDKAPISLMMIDIDHFKAFNDTYGHQAGDECLMAVSRVLEETISGEGSLVARYGGEEFVAVMPVDAAAALATAERTRLAVRLTALDALPGAPGRQTVSIGLASCPPGTWTDRDQLIAAADRALYQAKREGRNRVCVSPDPDQAADANLPLAATAAF
ncbi:GGDEF domain-containing protein [Hoeflea olei]|uniref:diguanylate cyclase n=1 Tax=Hoeflea olei TaxID=1480615 RepID=A0A1C1YZ01_9HYPH|nr:GGDEF domain-containing protein [Hoeflea olei]OCW58636.1 hypothetical protein AWJ14_05720 [Hoeflea olei]